MTTFRFPARNLLAGLLIALVNAPALASPAGGTDTAATSPTPAPVTAPTAVATSYNSDPSFGSMATEDYITPEADARPGEYFFGLGAQAYKKRQYQHAIAMYKVSASWAYKPAEYNLGLMYFRGQGISKNRPLGTAWMVLAAERNTPTYVRARDLMATSLSNGEFDRTNSLFGQLKPLYGDDVALRRAKVRWAQTRAEKTGSRTGGASGQLSVGSAGGRNKAAGYANPANSTVKHVSTSGWEISGGNSLDGSVAYAQFTQSSNPYDPKFSSDPNGTATVGALIPVKSVNGKPQPAKDTSNQR